MGPSLKEFIHRHLTPLGGQLVRIVALVSAASIDVARPLLEAFKIMSRWEEDSWLVLMYCLFPRGPRIFKEAQEKIETIQNQKKQIYTHYTQHSI